MISSVCEHTHSGIKAIETVYNGYRFRSRLEARWAVFFDALNIPYEYEPEGFCLSDGTFYLPDFYLPEQKEWFEVKGIMSEEDKQKIERFIEDTQMPTAVGYSDFTFQSPALGGAECYGLSQKDWSYIGKCAKCGKLYFVSEDGTYQCTCCGFYDGNCTFSDEAHGDRPFSASYPLNEAFIKARQARFEHGECG